MSGGLTHVRDRKILGPSTSHWLLTPARTPAAISAPFHISCTANITQPMEREKETWPRLPWESVAAASGIQFWLPVLFCDNKVMLAHCRTGSLHETMVWHEELSKPHCTMSIGGQKFSSKTFFCGRQERKPLIYGAAAWQVMVKQGKSITLRSQGHSDMTWSHVGIYQNVSCHPKGYSKDGNQLSMRSSACGCAHNDTSAKNQSQNNLGRKRPLRSSSTIKPALSNLPLKPCPYMPHLHIL